MTTPTKWSVRPVKTQINLGICRVFAVLSSVAEDPVFLHAASEESDQTGWMPRLIWVFVGHKGHFVGFVMRRLRCCSYVVVCLGLMSQFYALSLWGNNLRHGKTMIIYLHLFHSSATVDSNPIMPHTLGRRIALGNCSELGRDSQKHPPGQQHWVWSRQTSPAVCSSTCRPGRCWYSHPKWDNILILAMTVMQKITPNKCILLLMDFIYILQPFKIISLIVSQTNPLNWKW